MKRSIEHLRWSPRCKPCGIATNHGIYKYNQPGVQSVHHSLCLRQSTTNHMAATIGIVGHWTLSDDQVRHGLLRLRKIDGAHTGKNQCSILWALLNQYNFHKIRYLTLDHMGDNDTAPKALAQKIMRNKDMTDHQDGFGGERMIVASTHTKPDMIAPTIPPSYLQPHSHHSSAVA